MSLQALTLILDMGFPLSNGFVLRDVFFNGATKCLGCKHLTDEDGGFCAAFPDGEGIPTEVVEGKVQHLSAIPGDHGIQFEEA
jgi:hypothetical protein